MHRRKHSGGASSIKSHSSHVRSLMDSPGSGSDGDSISEDAEDSYSLELLEYRSQSQTSGVSSHQDEQRGRLPLHKQHGNATDSSANDGNPHIVMNTRKQESSNDAKAMQHHQQQKRNGQSQRPRYQNTLEKAARNMKHKASTFLKENKTPENQQQYSGSISRTSTFESESASTYYSGDASVSARSHGNISPARSRVSFMDIDEQSQGRESINNSAAPLVLGSEAGASSTHTNTYSYIPDNHNQNRRRSTQHHEQHPENALILSNEKSAVSEISHRTAASTNPMLKNLLSTVQLPRPRLIPFSPIISAKSPQAPNPKTPATPASPSITAASFAKQAPKAGFLRKLGNSVVEYKQRFFVLKPTTCLYYFLSPNDDEPRGCIDLDGFVDPSDTTGMGGMQVNSLGTLPDGRFRFECVLPIQNEDRDGPQTRKILLEARNEEIGKSWMQALTVERLSYSKATGELLKDQVRELESNVKELEGQVDELRLVEKDRDGAIQDAKNWRQRSEKLDSALNSLKHWLSRSVDDTSNDAHAGIEKTLTITQEEKELDEFDLPGTNFSSLVNVCRGLKENLRLTSIETTTALEDLQASNKESKSLQERLEKAEQYICKLWEENCSARDSLKQRKNEKKILVNEVKSLMEKASSTEVEIDRLRREKKELEEQCKKLAATNQRYANMKASNLGCENQLGNQRSGAKYQLNTPEKRLLLELEEHVNTSLFQHEHLLNDSSDIDSPPRLKSSSTDLCVPTTKKSNKSVDMSSIKQFPHKEFEAREGETTSEDDTSGGSGDTDEESEDRPRTHSPLLPKSLSLMDQAALTEKLDVDIDSKKSDVLRTILNSPSSLSLTSSNLEVFEEVQLRCRKNGLIHSVTTPSTCTNDEDEAIGDTIQNHLDAFDTDGSASGPSDRSHKSLVTDNGKATSKLACPLTDVTQSESTTDQSQIYSLTFYTQRIGLQFQKVPSNLKETSLLTDAMKADLGDTRSGNATVNSRTEAELKFVASLSSPTHAAKAQNPSRDQNCPVLLPKHYVLVCGFQGFDECSNNRRPSLGARLVGFDGISIERGPWSFETVRKAIKARSRPLTLTFRDDYLTTEQRLILTKAANDVGLSNIQPPRPSLRNSIPGTINAVKGSSERMIKSASFSDVSKDYQLQDDNTTLSTCSRSSDNWKTFSDAGSSVTSPRFSPLMANLLAGISSNGEKKKAHSPYTPEYFRRSNDSLDSASHREFKASLL